MPDLRRIGTLLLAIAGLAQSQTGVPPPGAQFEVATIKPSGVCEGGGTPQPGRLKIRCATVAGLIQMAYGYFENGVSYTPKILQISGGSNWLTSDRYDVEATAEGNPGQAAMRGPVLQALLADRFKLRFHRDTKEGPVYALTVAKRGVKMPSVSEGSCKPVDLPLCGTETRRKSGAVLTVDVHGISTADLAEGLFVELSRRTVVDKTGLSGLFNLHVEFTPDQTSPNNSDAPHSADDETGPSIFTAIREQPWLKLESAKGPVKVFIVDHVERPSGN